MTSNENSADTAADVRDIVVTSMSSDAHTWNLVFLHLLLEELGHRVTNLGACVPDRALVDACQDLRPDLVVISSVNGHGLADGLRVIAALRAHPQLVAMPVVIGGKLDTAGADHRAHVERLRAAGFDGVFTGAAALDDFRSFLAALPARPSAPPLLAPVEA